MDRNSAEGYSNNQIVIRDASAEDALAIMHIWNANISSCLLYTSPSPRDRTRSRMPSSA